MSSPNSYVKALTPNVFEVGLLCVCAKSLQLCLTLCYPTDCSPPGSSVHGILQARILEWVAVPSSRGSSGPRDLTLMSLCALAGRFFTSSATWGFCGDRQSGLDEVMKVRLSHWGQCLWKTHQRACSLSLPCEDAVRRCLSTSQEGSAHQELNQPASSSWTSQPPEL